MVCNIRSALKCLGRDNESMSHDEPLITNPATEEDEDEDDGGDEYEAADEVKDEEDDDREEANDEMKY